LTLVVLSGEVDSGKTSWCKSFSGQNKDSDGILLEKVYRAGIRIGYDARRIATGETVPFSRLMNFRPPEWQEAERVGPFEVSAPGKEKANDWLVEALFTGCRHLIVDEIGPLELRGGGLARALQRVLDESAGKQVILVIRRSCLERALAVFGISDYKLVETGNLTRDSE
jgi:nucleoside-triphosphatase THEP1